MAKHRDAKREKSGASAEGQERGDRPWRIRFDKNVLTNDVDEVGYAAMEIARKVIEKKLKVDPIGYGGLLKRDLKGLYKIKTSDIRIVYHVIDETHEVWILMIGNRRDIWEDASDIIVARRGAVPEGPIRPLADVQRVQKRG
jgi:mRNA-degrading endonuclease RelE of RelBE toxin-antitoxin system